MELFADYHTHTIHSHGTGTVEDNVVAAIGKGLEQVAITDHGPANFFGLGVKDARELLEIKREVERVSGLYPGIRVLVGVEANIVNFDGEIDVPEEILREMDVLLVGYHPMVAGETFRDSWKLTVDNFLGRVCPAVRRWARIDNTKALVRAVKKHRVDIVTHPGYRVSIDTKELAKACAERGTALEINSSHTQTTPEFIRIARYQGAKFAINSDAHDPGNVGNLDWGLKLAREAGLPEDLIINARA